MLYNLFVCKFVDPKTPSKAKSRLRHCAKPPRAFGRSVGRLSSSSQSGCHPSCSHRIPGTAKSFVSSPAGHMCERERALAVPGSVGCSVSFVCIETIVTLKIPFSSNDSLVAISKFYKICLTSNSFCTTNVQVIYFL